MIQSARILSESGNYAIVQLPGRNYPGVVIQGDSLHSLLSQIESIQRLATKYNDEELDAEIFDVKDLLSNVKSRFEAICTREGISLPY